LLPATADWLRGFWAAGPPKVPFSILIVTTLTTVLHYRADCERHSVYTIGSSAITEHSATHYVC